MGKTGQRKTFDTCIDEYLYYCHSRRLRPKTMASYEQALRLFERWIREQKGLERPCEVTEQTIRHYICDSHTNQRYNDQQLSSKSEGFFQLV